MPIKFNPQFSITSELTTILLRIEALKHQAQGLVIAPVVLQRLRESSRLRSIHYSTKIEGNRLTCDEVEQVLFHDKKIVARERDEREVKGYYAALDQIDFWIDGQQVVTEKMIQILHALVMAGGRKKKSPTPYRDGQNVIRDSATGRIVYLPPEAKDIAKLMQALVVWVNEHHEIPWPIRASIAHYQFVTIHPYYDGNGRTARLLTTFLLRYGEYGLNGIYELDAYYANDLAEYYDALTVGSSHNYYFGRQDADITSWIVYFCTGMLDSFERVVKQLRDATISGVQDAQDVLRLLDVRQQRVLSLFTRHDVITAKQIAMLLNLQSRTISLLCNQWVEQGFLVVEDPSRKGRKYRLADKYSVIH